MSLRAEFVDVLFDRLSLRYGRAFLARGQGLDLHAVKADWARELSGYVERPEAIEHALALVDPAEPPTAALFRELCSTAPAPAFRYAAAGETGAARGRGASPVPAAGDAEDRPGLEVGRRHGAACPGRRARTQVQPAAGARCLEPARLAAVAPRWKERTR